jgi:hypothetical protein
MKNTERLARDLETEDPELREKLNEAREARDLQVVARSETVDKMNDHVRSVQTRVNYICG